MQELEDQYCLDVTSQQFNLSIKCYANENLSRILCRNLQADSKISTEMQRSLNSQ